MKRKFLVVLLAIVAAVCMTFGLVACKNSNENQPEFYIGQDGHLYGEMNGTTTDYGIVVGSDGVDGGDGQDGQDGVNGEDGQDGEDGLTPYIGENGNWWIGDTDTGVAAQGPQGSQGSQGVQGPQGPQGPAGADGEDGKDGSDGQDGEDGEDGQDGLTPYIGENGNWWIGNTDTGIASQGPQGPQGQQGSQGIQGPAGEDGKDGVSVEEVYISDGNLFVKLSNSETAIDLGKVVGTDGTNGTNGEDGTDGIGIASITFNETTGHLVVKSTEGTELFNGSITCPHTYRAISGGVEAACVSAGCTVQECTICHAQKYTFIPAKGHTYSDQVTEPTCTSFGFTLKTCSDCGHTEFTNITAATGHSPSLIYSPFDNYFHSDICSVCGASILSGHTYEYGFCTLCGYDERDAGYSVELTLTPNESGTGYAVNGWEDYTGSAIVIPAYYNGLPVTKVGGFADGENIESIVLPVTVQEIAFNGFWHISVGAIYYMGTEEQLEEIEVNNFNSGYSDAPKYFYSATQPDEANKYWRYVDGVPTVWGEELSYSLNSDKDGYMVTGIGLFEGATEILASYNGLPVTSIVKGAFKDNTTITKVILPEGLESIGDEAFSGCTALTEISIPNSVTEIGDAAFYRCRSLAQVTIENGMQTLGSQVFYECEMLNSLTLPKSLTAIGAKAFFACTSLESINIPGSVAVIEENTFSYCDMLKTVMLGEGITEIMSSAFYYCEALTEINIPSSVMKIGDSAFMYCGELTNVTINSGVSEIGYGAFYYCDKLASIVIPQSVKFISMEAFHGCSALKNVTFEITEGWKCNGVEISNADLANTETAATYLTDTHSSENWEQATSVD